MLKKVNMDKVDLNKIQSSLNKILLKEENQLKQKELEDLEKKQTSLSCELENFKEDFFNSLNKLPIKGLNEFTDIKYSEIHSDLYCCHLINNREMVFNFSSITTSFFAEKKQMQNFLEDKYKVSLYDVCKEKYNISVSEDEFNQNKFLYKTMLINDFFSKALKEINSRARARARILKDYGFDYNKEDCFNKITLNMQEYEAKTIINNEKKNLICFKNSFISINDNEIKGFVVKYITVILNQILPKEHFLHSFNKRVLISKIAFFFKRQYSKDLNVCIKEDIKNNLPLFIAMITEYLNSQDKLEHELYIKYLLTLSCFYSLGSKSALDTLKTTLNLYSKNKQE